MITHGKKQISEIVYARKASDGGGAVRLTNIIRGAQVVFGGKVPFNVWLTDATTTAILAAFGQDDGYAVLGATNAYLNALAATDKTKASALAGFINEDPMLVCSLGLQPQGVNMPIRLATIRNKSVSNHLYNGLILPTPFSQVGKMEMTILAPHNNTMILSGATSNTGMSGYYSFGGTNSLGVGTITRIGTWTLNVLVSVGLNFATNTKAQNVRIAGWNNASQNYDLTIKQWDILAVDDTTPMYQLVPFKTKEDEICFLNLVDLTLHHNVYTDPFTESYVKQDGVTPWTPLNQTP